MGSEPPDGGAITGFICFPGKVFYDLPGRILYSIRTLALYVYCECPYPITFVSRNFFLYLPSIRLLLRKLFLHPGKVRACSNSFLSSPLRLLSAMGELRHLSWPLEVLDIVTLLHQLYAQLLKVPKLPPERGQEKEKLTEQSERELESWWEQKMEVL